MHTMHYCRSKPLLIAALDLLSSVMPCRGRETSSGTIQASITGLPVCICSHSRQQSSKPQLHSSSYNSLVQQVCCRAPPAATAVGTVNIATVQRFFYVLDADPAMLQLVTAQLPTQIASLVHVAGQFGQQCACSCIMCIHTTLFEHYRPRCMRVHPAVPALHVTGCWYTHACCMQGLCACSNTFTKVLLHI
jgi:hypothetical protein